VKEAGGSRHALRQGLKLK